MQNQTDILIAADDAVTRLGLAALVQESEPSVNIAQCSSLDDALAYLATNPCRLVVLRLHKQYELSDLEQVQQHGSRAILIDPSLTANLTSLVEAGVCGLLFSPFNQEAMGLAIAAAGNGSLCVGPASETIDCNPFLTYEAQVALSPELARRLTAREREIVELILRGMSNLEIADSLHVSYSTVKAHVRRAMEKAGVGNRVELISRASDRGNYGRC